MQNAESSVKVPAVKGAQMSVVGSAGSSQNSIKAPAVKTAQNSAKASAGNVQNFLKASVGGAQSPLDELLNPLGGLGSLSLTPNPQPPANPKSVQPKPPRSENNPPKIQKEQTDTVPRWLRKTPATTSTNVPFPALATQTTPQQTVSTATAPTVRFKLPPKPPKPEELRPWRA